MPQVEKPLRGTWSLYEGERVAVSLVLEQSYGLGFRTCESSVGAIRKSPFDFPTYLGKVSGDGAFPIFSTHTKT
jgi:hypothetical protein